MILNNFIYNYGVKGGAISIKNCENVKIIANNFWANSAIEGGAIFSENQSIFFYF